MTFLDCDTISEEGLLLRWVLGRTTPSENERLETHLLECARCQEEVRLAVALRQELRAAPAGMPRRRRGVWGAGALLAAAGLAAMLALPVLRPESVWSELGGVLVAPVYLGVPVRADGGPTEAFERGMAEYAHGRWDAAARLLERVAPADPPAEFFLGASLLMRGRDDEAAAAFRRVIDGPPSPYVLEARYYLAKALLRASEPEAALRELRAAATADAPPELTAPAASLADSVEARLRR